MRKFLTLACALVLPCLSFAQLTADFDAHADEFRVLELSDMTPELLTAFRAGNLQGRVALHLPAGYKCGIDINVDGNLMKIGTEDGSPLWISIQRDLWVGTDGESVFLSLDGENWHDESCDILTGESKAEICFSNGEPYLKLSSLINAK